MKMKQNARKTMAQSDKTGRAKRHLVTEHPVINRCLSLMERKFCEPIGLKDLVEFSEMSWRGFHKAFVRAVGTNPGRFLRALRIEHAKRLLIHDDLQVKEIARRCGFRSDNTFCVAFRREVNMSPKRFQRQSCSAWRQEQN